MSDKPMKLFRVQFDWETMVMATGPREAISTAAYEAGPEEMDVGVCHAVEYEPGGHLPFGWDEDTLVWGTGEDVTLKEAMKMQTEVVRRRKHPDQAELFEDDDDDE